MNGKVPRHLCRLIDEFCGFYIMPLWHLRRRLPACSSGDQGIVVCVVIYARPLFSKMIIYTTLTSLEAPVASVVFLILDVFHLPLRLGMVSPHPSSPPEQMQDADSKPVQANASTMQCKENIRPCNKTTCPFRSRHFRKRLPMQRPPVRE
jgi:hypothetical protein